METPEQMFFAVLRDEVDLTDFLLWVSDMKDEAFTQGQQNILESQG